MDNEFVALLSRQTWILVERTNQKILRGIWIFSLKLDEYGYVYKFKARL